MRAGCCVELVGCCLHTLYTAPLLHDPLRAGVRTLAACCACCAGFLLPLPGPGFPHHHHRTPSNTLTRFLRLACASHVCLPCCCRVLLSCCHVLLSRATVMYCCHVLLSCAAARLSKVDQERVFPNSVTFDSPHDQEAFVREWAQKRTGLACDFKVRTPTAAAGRSSRCSAAQLQQQQRQHRHSSRCSTRCSSCTKGGTHAVAPVAAAGVDTPGALHTRLSSRLCLRVSTGAVLPRALRA